MFTLIEDSEIVKTDFIKISSGFEVIIVISSETLELKRIVKMILVLGA